jgi:methionyl-tRNA formyltransferase
MTTGLDAGDMLAQEGLAVGPDETAGGLEARLAVLGARLAMQVVDRVAAGPVEGRKQDPAQVTKAPKLTKERGAIDWSRPAATVCNHVRAMHPWPTAYTFLHHAGQPPLRLIVHRAAPADSADIGGAGPGTVLPSPADRLWVAAGSGVVEIRELQPEGKRRMSAADFLRGRRPVPGDRLGPEAP